MACCGREGVQMLSSEHVHCKEVHTARNLRGACLQLYSRTRQLCLLSDPCLCCSLRRPCAVPLGLRAELLRLGRHGADFTGVLNASYERSAPSSNPQSARPQWRGAPMGPGSAAGPRRWSSRRSRWSRLRHHRFDSDLDAGDMCFEVERQGVNRSWF